MPLKIETWSDNPILHEVCKDVSQGEIPKLRKTLQEMLKYLKNPKNAGIWMAAPQIGITKRFCICWEIQEWSEDKESIRFRTMINPVILETSEETDDMEEWCLSLPDDHGNIVIEWFVRRPTHITVAYLDEKWRKMQRSFSGFSARVVQHEVDHLDGILYIDKLVDPKDVRHD